MLSDTLTRRWHGFCSASRGRCIDVDSEDLPAKRPDNRRNGKCACGGAADAEHGIGTLVVVDKEFATMGIVSDRDIAMRVVAARRDPATTPVVEIMTAWPTTILLDTSVESALAEMRMGRMRRLPVLSGAGRLIGIVALDDILSLLAEEFSLVGEIVEREGSHQA